MASAWRSIVPCESCWVPGERPGICVSCDGCVDNDRCVGCELAASTTAGRLAGGAPMTAEEEGRAAKEGVPRLNALPSARIATGRGVRKPPPPDNDSDALGDLSPAEEGDTRGDGKAACPRGRPRPRLVLRGDGVDGGGCSAASLAARTEVRDVRAAAGDAGASVAAAAFFARFGLGGAFGSAGMTILRLGEADTPLSLP